jgi:hypothetical protein
MTQSGGFVILNEVKNPFSSHARTVEMKEPQDWILRGAFRTTQNDTLKKRLLPFSIVYYPNKMKNLYPLPPCVILNKMKNPHFFHCVILNEVKNPYLSRTATIGVKEPQEWILRLAFGKSQNDTRKCSTLPQFPLCVILNEVKNPYLSHTATVKVKNP